MTQGNTLNTGKKEYIVGYKKPPKEYQYKPGESGNEDGKEKGTISPIQTTKNYFKKNPKAYKKFVQDYINDPANRKHVVEMIDGKPTTPIDLTTGGKSFLPKPEEKRQIDRAFKQLE